MSQKCEVSIILEQQKLLKSEIPTEMDLCGSIENQSNLSKSRHHFLSEGVQVPLTECTPVLTGANNVLPLALMSLDLKINFPMF